MKMFHYVKWRHTKRVQGKGHWLCVKLIHMLKQQFSQIKRALVIQNKTISAFFFFFIQSQYWCVQLSHTSTCSAKEPNPFWIKRRLGLDYKASSNPRPQNGYYVHQRGQRAAPVAPQPRRRRLRLLFWTHCGYVKRRKVHFIGFMGWNVQRCFLAFAKAAVSL